MGAITVLNPLGRNRQPEGIHVYVGKGFSVGCAGASSS